MTSRPAPGSPLVLVGASVRALAESAHRAGWHVHAADLFADADLGAVAATAVRVPAGPDLPWPRGLESVMRSLPPAPVAYTGALENHPDLVDRLARERPLAGNAGDRLRAVRDPVRLARAVRAAGLSFPETADDPAGVPIDGSFLVKPRGGAGGRGIARWRGGRRPGGDPIWQRFVPGWSGSAAFAIDAAGPRLFGAARQLVGRAWCGGRGFAWCGAVDVPTATLPASLRAALGRLGGALADHFGLLGLVGVDLVVDPSGGVHVVEVNPRPTASLELVERATGVSAAATHLAAWRLAASARPPPTPLARVWAKAVVFADRAATAEAPLLAALAGLAVPWRDADGGWPPLADMPPEGATLAAGGPVLTALAAGRDGRAAVTELRRRVAAVRTVLRRAAVSPPDAAAGRPRPPPAGRTA